MVSSSDEAKINTSSIPAEVLDVERMRSLIETLSSYIEYYHGGAVEMVSFDGRTLQVRMSGACKGCALAPGTLHGWVEGTVRPFFPELEKVEAV
ncbi:MAG TPA: NifU family protein [Anaerolineae bacterium]